MELLFYLYIFFVGTFIGSFLTVVIDRLPAGKSFVTGRSHCDHCNHTLSWIDLIPLWSFLLQKGKCRYCKKKLSSYYPIIEMTTGALFVLVSFLVFGSGNEFLVYDPRYLFTALYFLFIVSSLIIIFFVDLKEGIIPFPVVAFALILTLLWYGFFPLLELSPFTFPFLTLGTNTFLTYVSSALGSFLFFFILFLATKGKGLGFGDVVYVFLMGFLLGFPNIIVAFYIAFLSGAIISLLLVFLGTKKMKGTIPFGPFLVSGTIISLFWGNAIVSTVVSYLL